MAHDTNKLIAQMQRDALTRRGAQERDAQLARRSKQVQGLGAGIRSLRTGLTPEDKLEFIRLVRGGVSLDDIKSTLRVQPSVIDSWFPTIQELAALPPEKDRQPLNGRDLWQGQKPNPSHPVKNA